MNKLENEVNHQSESETMYPHKEVQALLSQTARDGFSDKVDSNWRQNISKSIKDTSPVVAEPRFTKLALVASITMVVSLGFVFSTVVQENNKAQTLNENQIAATANIETAENIEPFKLPKMALASSGLSNLETAPLSSEYTAIVNDLEKIKNRITQI